MKFELKWREMEPAHAYVDNGTHQTFHTDSWTN